MERKHTKLRGLIREKFGTQEAFAKSIGLSNASLSAKLQGITEFKQSEMKNSLAALGVPLHDLTDIFFND